MQVHEFVLDINQRVDNVIRDFLTIIKINVIGAFRVYVVLLVSGVHDSWQVCKQGIGKSRLPGACVANGGRSLA